MVSKIGGYSSPIDLGLGQATGVTDPELFTEFTSVYRAIHMLNSNLDTVREFLGSSGGTGTPDKTLAFQRSFSGIALEDIEVGDLVCPVYDGVRSGIIKGSIPTPARPAGYEQYPTVSRFASIALTAAVANESVRVGVGPASIPVPGLKSGQVLWGYSGLSTTNALGGDGGIYLTNTGSKAGANGGTIAPMPVGVGILDGFAMFGTFIPLI